jgi:hypothetical protein
MLDPRDLSLHYIGKTHKRREWRLQEHIEHAQEGVERPVYDWIRSLLQSGIEPEIFVWRRIPADADWRQAEKDAIAFWSSPESIVCKRFINPTFSPGQISGTVHGVGTAI